MQLIKVLVAAIASSLVLAGPSQAGALADYNNGTAYFEAGNTKEAIKWFDKSIAYGQKGFAEPYINKGFCLQKLGYHDRAILCFNEAIKINPKVAVAYQNRGTAYLHLGRYTESLKDLNKAISLPRESSLSGVTVYIDRGRALAGLHRWKESFADFDYVLSMKATNANVEKLKLAAAEQKRKAQALMASTNSAEVQTTKSTAATTSSTTSSIPSTPADPSTPTKPSSTTSTPSDGSNLSTP